MTKITGILLTVALIISYTESAKAGREDRRQRHQGARIQQGVKTGELTKKEAHRLRGRQRHVNRIEKRAEADGVLTSGEKARIEKAQDRNSEAIYRQKHDDQQRPDANQPAAPKPAVARPSVQ